MPGIVSVTEATAVDNSAGNLGVPVVTTPELVKLWAEATKAGNAAVAKVLRAIQEYARFFPRKTMPLYDWWNDAINKFSK